MKIRPIHVLGVLIVGTLGFLGWKVLRGPTLLTERAKGLALDVYGGKPGSIRSYLDRAELKAMGIDADRAVYVYDSMIAPVFRKFQVELGDSKVGGRGAQAIQNIVWHAPDGESFETSVIANASDQGDIASYQAIIQFYWLCEYKLAGKGPFQGSSKIPAFWYGIETEADRFKAAGVKALYSGPDYPPSTWAHLAKRLEMRRQRLASAH